MKFKGNQRKLFQQNWDVNSWFYRTSSYSIRSTLEVAYGYRPAPSMRLLSMCQEDVALATSLFAEWTGLDKSIVVHALLTGDPSKKFTDEHIAFWGNAFRDINEGRYADV